MRPTRQLTADAVRGGEQDPEVRRAEVGCPGGPAARRPGSLGASRWTAAPSPRSAAGRYAYSALDWLKRVSAWPQYFDRAYPGSKPADWDPRLAKIDAILQHLAVS